MVKPVNIYIPHDDPNAAERKKDHIELAFKSKIASSDLDNRFSYEPIMSGHPQNDSYPVLQFLGKTFSLPMWVSSMTGGTEMAKIINVNLAKACGEFGMGMGLGSCRQLLNSDEYIADFDVKKYMGDQPLYVNLGIAQVEELCVSNKLYKITELINKLSADGLIIHVNPMQEWLQPEGDRYKLPPLETIKNTLDSLNIKIIVKEVGQGMGKESLRELLKLPLEAIDFAANGGTNFALLELLRSSQIQADMYTKLATVGHSAVEMVHFINELVLELGDHLICRQIIVSGGISDFLDGYYVIRKIQLPAVYGQASAFLKYAMNDYEDLQQYIHLQKQGLELANAFLKVK